MTVLYFEFFPERVFDALEGFRTSFSPAAGADYRRLDV